MDHVEWIPILVLLALALSVWAFLELADEVGEGDMQAFDRTVMDWTREAGEPNNPVGPRWFEEAMRDLTALGSVAVLGLVTVGACGYLWLQHKRSAVVYVLVAILGAWALSFGLKRVYDRARPDLFPHGAEVYTSSFPSAHSSMSTATYLTLGILLARYQKRVPVQVYLVALSVLVALVVGLSRIYLSVHWPSDVLAGWALGAAWALACWLVAAWLERRGVLESGPVA